MTITMYSLPPSECRACWATEKRFTDRKVTFTKVLVNEDPDGLARIKQMGYQSAPVVLIEQGGEVIDHWGGFQIDRIDALAEQVAA